MYDVTDLTRIDSSIESRAITFENPTGARGAGGTAAGGRKGAPFRMVEPGERVVLADIAGPGTVRHLWMTFPPAPPENLRAKILEVFYDDATEPSVSVPAVDFFGAPWGRPVALANALTTIQEARGFNSYIPMAFDGRIRLEFVNHAERAHHLYFQVDYTLEPERRGPVAKLHASYRRENGTVRKRDFVITDGLRGPGRFLGCNVGVRVLDGGLWYGEGEVKMYLDDDVELPTICGTGLEDYVGTAWGMGPHQAPYAGAPLDVRAPDVPANANPELLGFYRWHVLDPVVFRERLKVTIQQIGFDIFFAGEEERLAASDPAGTGYTRPSRDDVLALGIAERSDDYCATAYVLCETAQAVPRVDLDSAVADIERREYEQPSLMEQTLLAQVV